MTLSVRWLFFLFLHCAFWSISINHVAANGKANGFDFSRHNELLIATVNCCKRIFNSKVLSEYLHMFFFYPLIVPFHFVWTSSQHVRRAESITDAQTRHTILSIYQIGATRFPRSRTSYTFQKWFIVFSLQSLRYEFPMRAFADSHFWFEIIIETKRKLICHEAIINHFGETKCKHWTHTKTIVAGFYFSVGCANGVVPVSKRIENQQDLCYSPKGFAFITNIFSVFIRMVESVEGIVLSPRDWK